jgi:hypothetical protein
LKVSFAHTHPSFPLHTVASFHWLGLTRYYGTIRHLAIHRIGFPFKKNNGSGGIDGVTIERFEKNLNLNLSLSAKLHTGLPCCTLCQSGNNIVVSVSFDVSPPLL